jgi:[acyl-carrier-protein] S-malonyltransferase
LPISDDRDGLTALEKKRIAAVFPAFGCKYLGNEKRILDRMSSDLGELTARAVKTVDFSADMLDSFPLGDFPDELQSQYAAYLYGCAVSNVLKRSGVYTDYAAGYSMGLYAALYHAESITFEQGLECIRVAYELIRSDASRVDTGMGLVSGLERRDVEELISQSGELEIINANNRHSFMVAGYERPVREFLAAARSQGALHVQYLEFRSPYHSRFMNEAAGRFREYCSKIQVYDPLYRIVSTVDRRVITTWDEVTDDLAANINHPIDWHETMVMMIGAGVDSFIECGPGRSLYRMAKFVDGNFTVYYLHILNDLLASKRVCSHADAVNG